MTNDLPRGAHDMRHKSRSQSGSFMFNYGGTIFAPESVVIRTSFAIRFPPKRREFEQAGGLFKARNEARILA